MKKLLVVAAGLSLSFTLGHAEAADLPAKAPLIAPVRWSWTGFYLGGHLGAGWNQSDFDDGRAVIYGNRVRTPAVEGGGQVGYNWQAAGSPFVLSIEGAIDALGADGSNTCFAISGYADSSNCRMRPQALATLTGRFGYAAGQMGRTLLYAKGGAAWLRENVSITNGSAAPISANMDRAGWTVGAGIEQAIAPAWSMTLEYDYADFGRSNVATPASVVQTEPPLTSSNVPIPGGTAGLSQTMQSVKLGINMKFGVDTGARWDAVPARPLGLPVKATSPAPGTEIEVGGRVWYSFGQFQKDFGSNSNQTIQDPLASRLTYPTQAASGELFGRIDTTSNVFFKGFIGGGGLTQGTMTDEDWTRKEDDAPYSNTLSDKVTGSIGYATADLGYDMLRDRASKLGVFVGYNYYREDKSAKGCTQLANPGAACATPVPDTSVGITEDDRWQSLRVGINGVVALTDRLRLEGDAAYLPYVQFSGTDNHLWRTGDGPTASPESGTGQGVQLEAILSYAITPSFRVGVGGRYWAMWATGTDAHTLYFSEPCPCSALPVRTERYGSFLQASYTFDSAR